MIAHRNFGHVLEEVRRYDDDFAVFIHWDRRNPLTPSQRKLLDDTGRVAYIGEELCVNWASYGIVRATLLLCEKSLAHGDYDYFHLISDADVLTVSIPAFKLFFERSQGTSFMHHCRLETTSRDAYKLKYYHRLERYNIRGDKDDDKAYRRELREQMEAGHERELPQCDLYWGSAWWSLRRECVEHLVANTPFVERHFKDTLFPDEHFAQVVLMNSPLASTIVNDNLRYVSWTYRNGNKPAVIDRTDLPSILSGDFLFARKVDERISGGLIAVLRAVCSVGEASEVTGAMTMHEIVDKCVGMAGGFQGGMMYGVGGILVFLSQCLRLRVEPGLVTEECVRSLQSMAYGELQALGDETWETGSQGLLVALEYSRNIFPGGLTEEMAERLSEVEDSAMGVLLNCESPEDFLGSKFHASLLTVLEHGGRLDTITGMAWRSLGSRPDVDSSRKRFGTAHPGLCGLSGLGLSKLSMKGILPWEEWSFLL